MAITMKWNHFNLIIIIVVNCGWLTWIVTAIVTIRGIDVEMHTAGALCFRFSPSTDSTFISISIRFLPHSFTFTFLRTTTSTTIKVFQFMNVQQFRDTSDHVGPKRASYNGTKENTTKFDGIIFITISCYQVKEHPLTLARFIRHCKWFMCDAMRWWWWWWWCSTNVWFSFAFCLYYYAEFHLFCIDSGWLIDLGK